MFLHNSGSMFECELVLACYFLWTSSETNSTLTDMAYQDILMDIIRVENDSVSMDQIPHSVLNLVRNFYSLLVDTEHTLPYRRTLSFKNCQILGLFLMNHSSFSVRHEYVCITCRSLRSSLSERDTGFSFHLDRTSTL